ncbi:unnamed protein product [Adineta ricciae]|uniref:Uncharacterized protein n=1 Tax=Adineta ricciae TaxID=249248 RepID=A0A816AD56_ADIRI|nr:unnamed protein product [Adineta ricciae]CAF1594526.1 unnamed protein product [Adineta ricciae]
MTNQTQRPGTMRQATASIVAAHEWIRFTEDRILSLRISSDHLDDRLFSILSKLTRVDLLMTASPSNAPDITYLITMNKLKSFSIRFSPTNRPKRIPKLTSFIWHSDCSVEHFSTWNSFVLVKKYLFPTSSCSLMINKHITRLSLDLSHLGLALALIPYVPALEHFEIRLYDIRLQYSTMTSEFLQERTWSAKVKSLHVIAYDQLVNTKSFCGFVKLFACSLEHLSFYIGTQQCYLMVGRRSFERHLLSHLPSLKQLNFCVHSGLMNSDDDRRQTFDSWTKTQVISIFHRRQSHTRFTLPFVFDRVEHVCNGFVEFHSNIHSIDFVLLLPSVRIISFASYGRLTLALFTLIRQACPHLRRIHFKKFCNLDDDLIRDTQLSLTTVTELCLDDVTLVMKFVASYRLVCLIPNLQHLTIERRHLAMIAANNDQNNMFKHTRQVIIVENQSQSNKIQDNIDQNIIHKIFPQAIVTYRTIEFINVL